MASIGKKYAEGGRQEAAVVAEAAGGTDGAVGEPKGGAGRRRGRSRKSEAAPGEDVLEPRRRRGQEQVAGGGREASAAATAAATAAQMEEQKPKRRSRRLLDIGEGEGEGAEVRMAQGEDEQRAGMAEEDVGKVKPETKAKTTQRGGRKRQRKTAGSQAVREGKLMPASSQGAARAAAGVEGVGTPPPSPPAPAHPPPLPPAVSASQDFTVTASGAAAASTTSAPPRLGAASAAEPSVARSAPSASDVTISINRAPVLTLWAAVVAEREGYTWQEALSFGQAICGLCAASKGRRLGLYEAADEQQQQQAEESRRAAHASKFEVFGMHIYGVEKGGVRLALKSGAPIQPSSVEKYLKHAFAVMQELVVVYPPDEIGQVAYRLYEDFRPNVAQGVRGWGAKGELSFAHIKNLAEKVARYR